MITAVITDSTGSTLSADYDHDGQAGRDLLTGLAGWSGGVGVRSDVVERISHGEFATTSDRTGRSLTVDMLLERGDRAELWRLERAASGLFSDGGYGSLMVAQDGAQLECKVRLDGEVKVAVNLDGGFLTVQVPLRSPLPFLYGPWRESILRPVGAGVGLEFPLLKGGVLGFGSAVAQDEVIWNDGNATAYPQLVVTADAPGGFTVSLGSARVTYPYPTVASSPVVVDMTGSVTAGGADVSDRATASWAGVEPGGTAEPGFELLAGGTGFCVVKHRDTYI